MPDRLAAKMLKVAAFFLKAMHQRQRAIRGAFGNRPDKFVERILRNDAEQFAHFIVRDRVAAVCPRLLQQ